MNGHRTPAVNRQHTTCCADRTGRPCIDSAAGLRKLPDNMLFNDVAHRSGWLQRLMLVLVAGAVQALHRALPHAGGGIPGGWPLRDEGQCRSPAVPRCRAFQSAPGRRFLVFGSVPRPATGHGSPSHCVSPPDGAAELRWPPPRPARGDLDRHGRRDQRGAEAESAETHLLGEIQGVSPAADLRVHLAPAANTSLILLTRMGTGDGAERRPIVLFPGETSPAIAVPVPPAIPPSVPRPPAGTPMGLLLVIGILVLGLGAAFWWRKPTPGVS